MTDSNCGEHSPLSGRRGRSCAIAVLLCICLSVLGRESVFLVSIQWTSGVYGVNEVYSGENTTEMDNEVVIPHSCQEHLNFSISTLVEEIADGGPLCDPKYMARKRCRCLNPLKPQLRKHQYYQSALESNINRTAAAMSQGKDFDVVFLGDSITHRWNGGANKPQVFRQYFDTKEVQGLALGIPLDTTTNLLYRLLHNEGEFPPTPPRIWWVLIGTNDLSSSVKCSPQTTLVAIWQVIQTLKSAEGSPQIVLNSILPTSMYSSGKVTGTKGWETRIQWVNRRMECLAEATPGVEFFNATDLFMNENKLKKELLPDHVHPSVEGYRVWGKEIRVKILKLLDRNT